MKILATDAQTILIRFDKNEEILQGLISFAKEHHIDGATFSLIGAAKHVILSYYNLSEKKYEDHIIDEEVEITGVMGNISWMGEEVIIHAHGTFADKTLVVRGGHIKSLTVSATGEITLQKITTKLCREFDEETGLNLLQ